MGRQKKGGAICLKETGTIARIAMKIGSETLKEHHRSKGEDLNADQICERCFANHQHTGAWSKVEG